MKRTPEDRDSESQETPSKSAIKREMLALQALGERLLELGPKVWDQLELGSGMREALKESRRVKGNSALRRHVRRIGKLLREEDVYQVRELFDRIDGEQVTGEVLAVHDDLLFAVVFNDQGRGPAARLVAVGLPDGPSRLLVEGDQV